MSLKKKIKGKLNALIMKSQWYNENVFKGCKKFWNHSEFNLDVINLGSGASFHAFNYTNLPVKGANFALPSQYLLADYEILKNYSSFLRPGAHVILGTSLFSLDGYDVTFFDDRYYTFLYPSSIPNFSIQRLKKIRDVRYNPIAYYPLLSLVSEIIYRMSGRKMKNLPDNKFKDDAQRWMENCWAKEFSIDDFEAPISIRNKDLSEQAIEILVKIKKFCSDKKFELSIITPPISPELRDMLTPKIREQYLNVFQRDKRLSDVRFINFIDDKEFDNHNLFQNAYFLNQRGAHLFTNKVLSILNL